MTVALQGDYGKPRPALIVQADQFAALDSVAILPITSTLIDAPLLRLTVTPSATNGLRKTSQIMLDKPITVKVDKIGQPLLQFGAEDMKGGPSSHMIENRFLYGAMLAEAEKSPHIRFCVGQAVQH